MPTRPSTRHLLGVTPEPGQSIKLDAARAYKVIRTMGPDTPIGLPRGPNNIWTQGGLLDALPMR